MTASNLGAIANLIVALTGCIVALGGMVGVLLRRQKQTNTHLATHLAGLLEVLQKANVTLPSGARVAYRPTHTPDEQDALDFLAKIREQMK